MMHSLRIHLRHVVMATWPGLALLTFAPGEIRFEDATESAGLVEPLKGIMGHGGAFGDVDGDGDLDLYVGGFADRPDEAYAPAPGPVANVLLRNLGDGSFEKWAQDPVEIYARTSGAVFADLDNDGDPELYVANNCTGRASRESSPQGEAQRTYSKLFRNEGGRFTDISEASGACPETLGTARNVGVFDYNGDGLLDLFVVEDRFTEDPTSVLFENRGNLAFAPANASAGLPDDIFGLGLAVADLNGDALPDFFVGHGNRMFLSVGAGNYVEDAALQRTFAWTPLDGEDWPCGAAFGDLDRDGRLDMILAVHGQKARNRVYLNEGMAEGVPRFRDVTREVGLPPHVNAKSPHVEIRDFDNDGWPDVYFSSGWMDPGGRVTPLIYRNLGTTLDGGLPRFRAIFDPADNDGGEWVYFAAGPSGDYDRDGRLDLCLINWFRGNHTRLLRNVSDNRNRWLGVRVRGETFNRDGIGSQVKVYARSDDGGRRLIGYQELSTGYGYASGQEPMCHFGLGSADSCDLEIRFPNGMRKRLENVNTLNRILTIEE